MERIEEKKNLPALYTQIGERFKSAGQHGLRSSSLPMKMWKYMGRKADKNRKIYNGMMKTYAISSWVRAAERKPEGRKRTRVAKWSV